jgi:cystathionine beta-lyase
MALRMERAASSADAIARWLAAHPLVTKVNYPGLPGCCPGHAVHASQASSGGSLLSFETGRCAHPLGPLATLRRYLGSRSAPE